MTNEEVFIRAYDEVRLPGLSPTTVASYLGQFERFIECFNTGPSTIWAKMRFVANVN